MNKDYYKDFLKIPAIREKMEDAGLSAKDIIVEPDGTIKVGQYKISKEQTEKGELMAIIEAVEKEESTNAALDAPFSASEDYVSKYKTTIATLTYVDSDGIEIEKQEINNEHYVKKQIENGTLNIQSFKSRKDLVNQKYVREDGLIKEYDKSGREIKFYDHGNWDIKNLGLGNDSEIIRMYSFETDTGDKPSYAIANFDKNSRKLMKKYPHLQENINNRRKELMNAIDERTLSLIEKNHELLLMNENNQAMLNKALDFVQIIRDSKIGNLFFGREAKKIVGDKDKKQISAGREDER